MPEKRVDCQCVIRKILNCTIEIQWFLYKYVFISELGHCCIFAWIPACKNTVGDEYSMSQGNYIIIYTLVCPWSLVHFL